MAGVAPISEQKDILDAMMDAAVWGPGDMEVHLFANDIDPTEATVLTDFTVPTYDGYAPITDLDLNAPALDNEGNYQTVAKGTSHFVCSGDTTVNDIFGWYCKDKLGHYVAGERFDEPQTMAKAGDSIDFTVAFGAVLTARAVVSP